MQDASTKPHKIFIDGEAGTTGLKIREKLAQTPHIEIVSINPARRKDLAAKKELLSAVDLAVLCLPDDAAKDAAALIEEMGEVGPRILDASSAHRTTPGWTYGFPELCAGQEEHIAKARRVSNPGCHATGAIALLRPLIDSKILSPDHPLSIFSVSGYSGGGRQMIEAYENGGAPAYELYALGMEHKHTPEIVKWSGLTARPIFIPSVGAFKQGMIVQIPLHLDALEGKPKAAELEGILKKRYEGCAFVCVIPPASSNRLEPEALKDTNKLEIVIFANENRRHALLTARFDNLGKGASGAAIQNIGVMLASRR